MFVWDPQEASWEKHYNALVAFEKERGHCLVPQSFANQSMKLGNWVKIQRKNYKKLNKSIVNGKAEIEWSSEMTKARFVKLTKVGFVWKVKSGPKKGKSPKIRTESKK